MPRKELWVWLNSIDSMTPVKITNLLDVFGYVDTIYSASEKDYKKVAGISEYDISHLTNKKPTNTNNLIRIAQNVGAKIITYDDENYPQMLKHLHDPPYVLYLKGEVLNWDELFMLSIVGPRMPSQYGIKATEVFAKKLANCGVTIVSGMARGLDSIAHRAAIDVGGKTVAVLGCGIDVVYPPENKKLMDDILNNGCVITEFAPSTAPLPHHFPRRNRIIAALSRGMFLAEAQTGSGSLISANLATDLGKDVFVLPGDYCRYKSRGTNKLIQDGCKVVCDVNDIFEEYPDFEVDFEKVNTIYDENMNTDENTEYNNTDEVGLVKAPSKKKTKPKIVKPTNEKKPLTINDDRFKKLNYKEKEIIKLLLEGKTTANEIHAMAVLSVSEGNSTLTMLEMRGVICQLPGKVYKIKD